MTARVASNTIGHNSHQLVIPTSKDRLDASMRTYFTAFLPSKGYDAIVQRK